MDINAPRKTSTGAGAALSSQTFKFSDLRGNNSDEESDGDRRQRLPRPAHQQDSSAPPSLASTPPQTFEDFLDRVPPPPTARGGPRKPSEVAKTRVPPPPPPPPPLPPPPSFPPQQARQFPQASLPQPPLSLPPSVTTSSAKPNVVTNSDDDEDEDYVSRSVTSATAEPWPFLEQEQRESEGDSSANPRILRTDEPPPNPLARKFPLIFALIASALAVVCSAPLPLPEFAKGLIIGCSLTCSFLVYFYLEYLANRPVVVHYTGVKYCKNPKASVLAAGVVTSTTASKRAQKSLRLDGFLNESWSYDVERHHLNHTFTVYACLEGRQLTVRRPSQPQVQKRVLHSDELASIDSMSFSDTRQFDLLNARLRLLPLGLVRKRLWSKKYPIHVVLSTETITSTSAPPSAHVLSTFEDVRPSDCVQRDLYLFARTSREKELWYRRLYAACNGLPQPETLYRQALESGSLASGSGQRYQQQVLGDQAKRFADYVAAFGRFADISDVQLGNAERPELNFLNALLLRSTWDVFRTTYWADLIKAKMDARLKKIRLPYFIEELSVADVNVGSSLPVLRKLHKPYVNDRGVWFHLDIDYPGGCSASLVTRINLHRLQDRVGGAAAPATAMEIATGHARAFQPSASTDSISGMAGSYQSSEAPEAQRLAATNSELEDSGESTTEESSQSDPEPDADDPALGSVGGKRSRKVIKFIDKVAKSEKFHSLMGKYKFLRNAVQSVSNTKILLSVDVHSLNGTLVLNLPFPPSDRVWVAFLPVPQLVMTARPKIGEKEFSARKISDVISKKLIAEFHRVMVLPNMEDFYLPTLNSDEALLATGVNAASRSASP